MTVIIDPSTGKLIDIESFNYYYDYAVGSNSLTFTRRYPSMTLYKYGNWGDNMKISNYMNNTNSIMEKNTDKVQKGNSQTNEKNRISSGWTDPPGISFIGNKMDRKRTWFSGRIGGS